MTDTDDDYEDTPEVRRVLADLAPTRARREELLALHGDTLRTSAAGYLLKHDHGAYDEDEFEEWVRVDVERISDLSPSDRFWLIHWGIGVVWKALDNDRVTKRLEAWTDVRSRWSSAIAPDAQFRFEAGWRLLLEHAAERVTNMHPNAWKSQIGGGKEKFGCLVLHIDYDRDQPGSRAEVERLREEIRLTSLGMCQICGGAGRLRLGGFAATLCNRHAAYVGELRIDDGLVADPHRWPKDSERGTSHDV